VVLIILARGCGARDDDWVPTPCCAVRVLCSMRDFLALRGYPLGQSFEAACDYCC